MPRSSRKAQVRLAVDNADSPARHAATLADVALRAGVSKAAVSVVMSGSQTTTIRVSDTTRERIMEAVRALKFQPNALAQGLNGVRIKSIGLSFATGRQRYIVTGHYSATLLQGILDATFEAGYNTNIFQRPWLGAVESAAGFRSQGIDGFLIMAPLAGSDMVAGLSALGIPLVVVSGSSETHNAPSVDVDNGHGVRLALEHLIGLGHMRIAHLTLGGDVLSFDSAIRKQTFLETMAAAGLPVPARYLIQAEYSYTDEAAEAVRALMALPEPPTALFTTNDSLARRVIEALTSLGVRVPEQFSVVGFDDNPEAAKPEPPLTTVRQPLLEMGAAATRLLISLIESEDVRTDTHWFMPELIVRGTTARVPSLGGRTS
jgi:LacI family transcriptional regulator